MSFRWYPKHPTLRTRPTTIWIDERQIRKHVKTMLRICRGSYGRERLTWRSTRGRFQLKRCMIDAMQSVIGDTRKVYMKVIDDVLGKRYGREPETYYL